MVNWAGCKSQVPTTGPLAYVEFWLVFLKILDAPYDRILRDVFQNLLGEACKKCHDLRPSNAKEIPSQS
jgi:hypothetical protein